MADNQPTEQAATEIEAAKSGAWGTQWETIIDTPTFITERLKVPNGWALCFRGAQDAYRPGAALVFIPQVVSGNNP